MGTHAHRSGPSSSGISGTCALVGQRGIARKEPDQAVAHPDRVGAQADRGERAAEEVVGDRRQPSVLRVGPAVVRAGERAPGHVSERELELPVRAAILERSQAAVGPAVERDGLAPEGDLHHLAGLDRAVVLDRVPVVGVQAGRPDPLAPAARLAGGRRAAHVATSTGAPARAARRCSCPLADRQPVEEPHHGIQLDHGRVGMGLVPPLLGLEREPVLPQQRLDDRVPQAQEPREGRGARARTGATGS